MGAYDLYGTYYPKTQDALVAETAQMAEIDGRHNRQELDDYKQNSDYILDMLNSHLQNLEHRIEELEVQIRNLRH